MVEPTHLKNIGQIGSFPQIVDENKTIYLKPPPKCLQYFTIHPSHFSNTFPKKTSQTWYTLAPSDLVVVIPESLDFLKIRKAIGLGDSRTPNVTFLSHIPKRPVSDASSGDSRLDRPMSKTPFEVELPYMSHRKKLPYKQIRSCLFWVDSSLSIFFL